jgi:hypothetical protein
MKLKMKNFSKFAFISCVFVIPLVCNGQNFLDPNMKPCNPIDANILRSVATKNGGFLDTTNVRSTNDYTIKNYSFNNDVFGIVVRVNSNRVQSLLISFQDNPPFSEIFLKKISKLVESEFGVETSEKNIDDVDTAFRTIIRGRVWPVKNMVKAEYGDLTMSYIGDPRFKPTNVWPLTSKNFTFTCASIK